LATIGMITPRPITSSGLVNAPSGSALDGQSTTWMSSRSISAPMSRLEAATTTGVVSILTVRPAAVCT
jgi:hypothetical protein